MEAMMRWMQSLIRRRGGDVHAVHDGQLVVSSSLGRGSGERIFSETKMTRSMQSVQLVVNW